MEPSVFVPSSAPYTGVGYCNNEDFPYMSSLNNGSPRPSRDPTPVPLTYQENVNGTTYFYGGSQQPLEPSLQSLQSSEEVVGVEDPNDITVYPNYTMYTGPPTYLTTKEYRAIVPPTAVNPLVYPAVSQIGSYFVQDELRLEIINKNSTLLSQPNPAVCPEVPTRVEHYEEICPLETQLKKSPTFGYHTTVYKAVNTKNGFTYCLKRIHGFRLQSGKSLAQINSWKEISHCNMVQFREIFTTKDFNDSSLIFVYDYFPMAESLMTRHFEKNSQANGFIDPFSGDPSVPRPYSHQKNAMMRHHASMLPEPLLWAYIVQLTSVIRIIHAAGLAVRCLEPSKVLLVSPNRPALRLNNCGIFDVIMFDPAVAVASMVPAWQQDDLMALGKLIMALACNSVLAIQTENLPTSLELISRSYSQDLRNLIVYLMNPRSTRCINDTMPMIGARFYTQLDAAIARADVLENNLAKEIENGRLLRLLVKLNTIVERQELNMDPAWSETGGRYLLKLFRDYVFHPVDREGRPSLDMSHVISCLNRLDVGVSDKVWLMSRDEQNVLLTTYHELKLCIEQSFSEILSASNTDNSDKLCEDLTTHARISSSATSSSHLPLQ